MSFNILWWETILAPFTCLHFIACILMQLQLSHRIHAFAEPASTRFQARLGLMVEDVFSRELKPTEPAPNRTLLLIASLFMSVKVD